MKDCPFQMVANPLSLRSNLAALQRMQTLWSKEYLNIAIDIGLHNCKTWFVVIPRKHPEVKFGSQEDKQVCQTWKLFSKYQEFLPFFAGNLRVTKLISFL